MKELGKKTKVQETELLQQDSITDSKKQIINMIESSQDNYFIRSVLTYARCLDRTLKKM